MVDYCYQTQLFSGPVLHDVNQETNNWLLANAGQMEITSSNFQVFQDPNQKEQPTFVIYLLYVRFPSYDE